MKKKNKFLVFILSPLPGLSHLYLGWSQRALIFFAIFLGICAGGAFMDRTVFFGRGGMEGFIFFAIALLWFMALSEALSLVDYEGAEDSDTGGSPESSGGKGVFKISNRKIIAVAFSAIPGAGHMYLGLLKQGAQLMAAFFFALFMTGWLDMGLLGFIVPVIWFYSLFDVYHLLEEEDQVRLDASLLFDWFATHPGWVGWGLIALGLLVIMQRIVSPLLVTLLTAQLQNYLETGLVALILIAGGIKLLTGSKSQDKGEEL